MYHYIFETRSVPRNQGSNLEADYLRDFIEFNELMTIKQQGLRRQVIDRSGFRQDVTLFCAKCFAYAHLASGCERTRLHRWSSNRLDRTRGIDREPSNTPRFMTMSPRANPRLLPASSGAGASAPSRNAALQRARSVGNDGLVLCPNP